MILQTAFFHLVQCEFDPAGNAGIEHAHLAASIRFFSDSELGRARYLANTQHFEKPVASNTSINSTNCSLEKALKRKMCGISK